MKIKNLLRALTLLTALLLLTVSTAATAWEDMYENGAISDGGIAFGDARDGIVSDVSQPNGHEAHSIRNGTGAHMGGGSLSAQSKNDAEPQDGNTVTPRTAGGDSTADGTAMGFDGMILGMALAILVVIAVIALVILLRPKRRG